MENERLAYIYSVAFDEGYDKGYQDGNNHMTRYCPDCGARMDDRTGQIERIDNT